MEDFETNHNDISIARYGIIFPKGILYWEESFLFLKIITAPAVDINSINLAITVKPAKKIKSPYIASAIVKKVVNKIEYVGVLKYPFLLKIEGRYLVSDKASSDLGEMKDKAIVIPPIDTKVATVINKYPVFPKIDFVAWAIGIGVKAKPFPKIPIQTIIIPK